MSSLTARPSRAGSDVRPGIAALVPRTSARDRRDSASSAVKNATRLGGGNIRKRWTHRVIEGGFNSRLAKVQFLDCRGALSVPITPAHVDDVARSQGTVRGC